MKHYILKQIATYLTQFKTIKYIKRIDNNTIKIEFTKDDIVYFDLTRGNGNIYKKKQNENTKKDFNAPFDIILQKKFTNSSIQNVELLNDDKIIRFTLTSKSKYKSETSYLQLEFTGKHTNIIVLDQDEIILEALRHIDEYSSIRVIKVGLKLMPLEKPNFNYEERTIDDIENYLFEVYNKKQNSELQSIKKQKIAQIIKSQQKIEKLLKNLDDVEKLELLSNEANLKATNILCDIYNYDGYEKQQKIKNSNDLFRDAKKLKQKAKNQYLEELNLSQKLQFYKKLQTIIENCKTINEIEFYIPKKDKNQTKTKKANPYQEFFIDGYKIMLGRDERENIYLLQNSRASDFWFHLQEQVSSHVIVSNTKKTIPEHIIYEAATICAKFSTTSGGVYRVDFTQRRNVKIQNRANVLYNPYSTIEVKI